MKTIGLITFFNSYNYGVWLQAYATEQFLMRNGYDVEIIYYINPFEGKKLHYSYRENNRFFGYFTSFLKSILFGKVKYYKKGFGNHVSEYYRISKKNFTNINQMQDLQYDILIAGSDQIWNPETTNQILDKAFLLQFGNAKKRISLASSIGSTPVRQNDEIIFKTAFKTFNAISVRERFAKEQLQPFSNIPIEVICDPTFLLAKDVWEKLAAEKSLYYSIKANYILTYFVAPEKRSERYINILQKYTHIFRLPIWEIQFSSYPNKMCDKSILGATIADFIALILNAEFIITDSFHGCALSVNLNKDFVVIENEKNPERTRHLLQQLGLRDRINLKAENFSKINYDDVNPRIEKMRTQSATWILNAVE